MQAITFVFAFVAVLALIGVAAWLVRRFAGNRLGANANRGRMPRLAVIDAAAVDGRRRLVLVRRDNVEHLLMIGGPTDIVVEPNIVRASPSRDQMQRPNVGTELPRLPALSDSPNWPEGEGNVDHPEPHLPEPPPRPARPAFADEGRRPVPVALSERRAESLERRADPNGRPESPERRADPAARADSIAGFVPEPLHRTEPRPEPRVVEAPPTRIARSEPPMIPRTPLRPVEPPARMPPLRVQERTAAPPPVPPAPAPVPVPVPSISADQNLADMAQRLEAALRRPPGEARSDAAEPRLGVLPIAPESPPIRPAPRSSNDGSPNGAARNETPAAAPSPKSGFENLEDEMASLLGRPKSSSS
jgi:flagellar protein FliO/FliZ